MVNYRFPLGFFLIGLLALLAACGSTSSPSSSQGVQMTTPAPHMGQTPANSTGMQAVQVTLFDDHMSSSVASFATGTRYHFVVTNNGHQPYDFAMMQEDREQGMEHMSMAQRRHAALYMENSIAPGQTMSFDYTFASSMMGQHLEFACYPQGSNQVHMRFAFTPQS